jgi:hypothetical protein
MVKHPQDRFRRLAIVGPTNSKPRQQPAERRWWGPECARGLSVDQEDNPTPASFQPIRMAVMPVLSRSVWFAAMAWIWNFLRDYFVTERQKQRGAVVLSFRRHAAQARGFRLAMADKSFVSKKANGSIRWKSDHEVAPQEGGRR